MHNVTFRRRNRLAKHFVITPNVLLYGYGRLSDGAKLTYQVIDSFDWADGEGLRKGFVYPSVRHLAAIRAVSDRTIQRHIEELIDAGLLTREERPGRTNILYIEGVSKEEARLYERKFVKGQTMRGDDGVTPPVTEMSPEERRREEKRSDVNDHEKTSSSEPELVASTEEREYLVNEMLSILQDPKSEGYYRRLAANVPRRIIFEALSLVKRAVHEGKIRNSRGALFVGIVKRAYGR